MTDSFHRTLDRALNSDRWLDAHDLALHEYVEKHLMACEDALAYSEDGDPWRVGAEEAPEDPSYGPFCGCTTCVVREVLTAAWFYVTEVAADV